MTNDNVKIVTFVKTCPQIKNKIKYMDLAYLIFITN